VQYISHKSIKNVRINVRSGRGYYRIHLTKNNEISIPLKTSYAREIKERAIQVRLVEDLIKSGKKISFNWLSEADRTEIWGSIDEYFKEFMKNKIAEGLAPKTISGYKEMYQKFQICTNVARRADTLRLADIENYKQYLASLNRYAIPTINKCLREVRAFTNSLYEHEVISRKIKVKLIREEETINFINDENFELILSHIPRNYRKIYRLYAFCGMRLSEGFLSKLVGNTLVVDAKYSKSRRMREIELDEYWVEVWKEMIGQGKSPQFYSKLFKKAARAAGLGHFRFHDLRHRFGVRTYATTRDILYVSRAMGHSSLSVTERYEKFKLSRLSSEFDLEPILPF
jgi:integrase